jgi:pimeloyl-ACP methyl ester carboxylesterase
MNSTAATGTDLVLIAGLWLPHSAWADVTTELTRLGHRVSAPPLPGVDLADADDGPVDLDDQLAAVLAAVDAVVAAGGRPVVVGHSAACTLAWIVADRRPDGVSRTVLIGGFPEEDGGTYADFFPMQDAKMPFPGWERFEGPDAQDLDQDARRAFTDVAVPVPQGVAQGTVRLADDRRFDVPVTLLCPEYGPDEAKAWIDAGDVPELARATRVSYVDIDSGHWPMITRPQELAGLLDRIARAA